MIDTEPLQNPWVNRLNESHKLKISNKEWICSDIVNAVQLIVSKQFPNLNGFQLTNLAPVYPNKCNLLSKFTIIVGIIGFGLQVFNQVLEIYRF